MAQRGDVRFDCFWRFLTSEMKLVRFIRFVCFTDTKIFKPLHDFPQVLHVSFLLELESIKYVHRVFSNSCQKYSALKLIRFLIKPARNSIILELAFELFPVMAKTSIGHIKFWWQRNICCVLPALHGGLRQEEKLNSFLTEWRNFDVLQASARFFGPFWIKWTLLTPCSVVEHKVNRTQVYKRCLLMFLVRQPFSKSSLIGQFTNDSDRGLCILNVSWPY